MGNVSPRFPALFALCLAPLCLRAAEPNLESLLDRDVPGLISTYQLLHAAPELSHHEKETSTFMAAELRKLGYQVQERVGKYSRPELPCYGVTAVLKNGAGPTVLIRSDMDALPVDERTALPYASRVRTKLENGQETGVMHACGHDVHITCLLGTARLLAELREHWHGTVVLIGQPSEETIDGAAAMLRDGLYEKVPRPDFCLALHDSANLEAGKIGLTSGYALASVDSVDITVRGVGGHGSRPEQAKDPIVIAAQIVSALQTIVSRETSPADQAVVTVGTFHAGTRRNIIPDQAKLSLTIRTYKAEVRRKILASIERIARHTALAGGIPEELAPIVESSADELTPATYNDPALTQRLGTLFRQTFGESQVVELAPVMGGEDFGLFSLEHKIPSLIFWLGATDPAKVAASRDTGTPLPALHSGWFAPLPEPTLRTGVKAMTTAVLHLMGR